MAATAFRHISSPLRRPEDRILKLEATEATTVSAHPNSTGAGVHRVHSKRPTAQGTITGATNRSRYMVGLQHNVIYLLDLY